MPGGNKPNLANGGIIRQHYHCLTKRTRKEPPKEYNPSSKCLPPVVGGAFATEVAALMKTRRRSSARREFFRSNGRAPIYSQKMQKRYRAPTSTLRCARPLQPRYHRCQWYAAPVCQQRKPPLTTMMDRFAWVVVLAPNEGCGRENREEEKGRRRSEEGWGRGCSFRAKNPRRPFLLSPLFSIIYLLFGGKWCNL